MGEILVVSTSGDGNSPSLVMQPDGRFLATWMTTTGGRARAFDENGTPTSREVAFSGGAITLDGQGTYTAVGASDQAAPGIHARELDSSGIPVGTRQAPVLETASELGHNVGRQPDPGLSPGLVGRATSRKSNCPS